MRNRTAYLLGHCWMGLVELLFFFSPILFVGAIILPEPIITPWLISLPLAVLLGATASILLRIRRTIIVLLIALAGGALSTTILTGWVIHAIIPLLSASILIWRNGLKAATEPSNTRLTASHYWSGLLMYFIGFFLFRSYEPLRDYLSLLVGAGTVAIILTVILSNAHQLIVVSHSADGQPAVPASLKRHNRVYIIAVLVVAFGIAAFVSLPLGEIISEWFRSFLRWLFSRSTTMEPPVDQPVQGELIPPELQEGEPSTFAKWLLRILTVFGVVLFIVVSIWIVFLLYRKFREVFRRLFAWMARLFRSRLDVRTDTGYVDETTRLLTLDTIRERWSQRLREWGSRGKERANWEDWSARERIRYVYRQFVRARIDEGYEYKAYLTPSETAKDLASWSQERKKMDEPKPDDLIRLYNQARYSDDDIDASEAERVRQLIEKSTSRSKRKR